MRRPLPGGPAVALVALLLSQSAFAQQAGERRVSEAVRSAAAAGRPVRVIVGVRASFRPEAIASPAEAAEQRAAIGERIAEVIARLPAAVAARTRRFTTIPFFAADVDPLTLLQLEADPDVLTIEADVAVRPGLAESGPLVGAPNAWSAGYSGAGWAVAILDTGVDKTHSFLSGKVVSEACYSNAGGAGGAISACPGGASSSTATGSGVNCDAAYNGCYHGTHVAGIAAGKGSSFSGIARDGNIIAIQVFTEFPASEPSCGGAACVLSYTSDQIAGLERVLALRTTYNIASANMSLGGGRYFDQASCDAANASRKAIIDNLRAAGIATVISSGNSGYADSLGAPACISSAISVGSTTKSDQVSSFSNTASFLSLLAPGSSITSSVPGGGFAVLSGTSMAAPHVTGAWADMKSRKPTASVSEVLAALRSTGVSVTDPLSSLAFPRIQVDAAVNALPPPAQMQMSLEAPVGGASLNVPFTVSGWAIDQSAATGTGVDAIHVYALPSGGGATFLGVASYGQPRSDVGATYGSQFTNSGFSLTVSGLASGTYQIVAYAHSSVTGTFGISRSAAVTVQAPVSQPRAAMDVPAANATVNPSFFVGGWALDLGASSGPGVDAIHVYAFPSAGGSPVFLGVASYGGSRPDVGAVFGSAFTNSGYGLITATLSPGSYTLVVYFRSTVSGSFSWIVRAITVRQPGNPLMSIDTPGQGATAVRPFLVAGWAIDLDSAAGAGVDAIHVWAFPAGGGSPVFVGVAAYGMTRDDVGAVFGSRFTNSGYNLVVSSLAAGTYQIAVYAHSSVTGTFNQSRAVTVTVQ